MRLVRPQVLLTVYAALAATVAGFYFLHYPIPGFFGRLADLSAASTGLLLCAAVGGRLWRFLRWPEPATFGEGVLFHAGTGLAVLPLGLLALGAAGFFRPGAIALYLLAAGVFSFREVARWRKGPAADLFGGWGLAPGGLALFALALAALCAFAPPTYYDSLVYHLALPAKYLQEGRVGFVPYNQYAHFPQNMEMVYGAFLALSGDGAAQLFNVGLAAAAALAMAVAGRAWVPGAALRWDLLLFVTAPCAVLLSSETYVEAPMAFAVTLSLMAGARALSSGDRRWWAVAGLLGGFLAGVKYTGVLTPVLLGVFSLAWPRARSFRERLVDFLTVGGVSFSAFLPWLVKNFVLTGGNPVFPFLPSFFPARNVVLPVESAQAYFQVLDEYKGSSGLLTELFLMPFRLATDAVSFGGGYDVTGDLGWALPLLLLPLAALAWKKGPFFRFLSVYAAAHFLLWASMRPVLRFLFPLFPAVCLLAGGGLAVFLADRPAWLRRATGFLLLPFFLSNGVLFYGVERVRDPFPVALGWQTREEYLHRKIDAYPALRWCDENLPSDGRLLMLGDPRGYYVPRPYLAPMALLPSPLKAWADVSADGEALRVKLLESGFTHVFFNRREAERLKTYRVMELTPGGRRAWEDFLSRGKEVHRDAAVSVYDLRP